MNRHIAKQLYQNKLKQIDQKLEKQTHTKEISLLDCLNSHPIFEAIFKNNTKFLQDYFASKQDLNIKNSAGMGLLEFALKSEHSDCVLEILNTQDEIFKDVYLEQVVKIEAYIKGNKNVNAKCLGLTLMEIAIMANKHLIVDLLIEANANFPIRKVPIKIYKNKRTNYEVVNDPNYVHDSVEIEMMEVYCSHGITSKVISYLLKGYDANIPGLLSEAVQNGHTGVAKALIYYGANINSLDNFGQSILILAISTRQRNLTKFIIESGIDCTLVLHRKNKVNALHLAAQLGETEIVACLLAKGMNVNQKNILGETPIFFSIAHGFLETAEFLFSNGARLDDTNDYGLSSLMVSVNNKLEFKEVTKFILRINHDKKLNLLDLRSKKGSTAAIIASSFGHLESLKAIVSAGASLWIEDINKKTALHWASEKGKTEIVKFILEEGLNLQPPKVQIIKHKSKEGLTPLEYAVKMCHIPVIKLFFKMGYGTSEALLIAIDSGSSDVFNCIIEEIEREKIDIDILTKALDRACQFDDSNLVKIIIAHLKEVDISKTLSELFQRMSALNHTNIIRILLERKISILSIDFLNKFSEKKGIHEYLNQFITIASDLLSKLQNGFTENGDIIIPLQHLTKFLKIDAAYLLKESNDTLIRISSENIVAVLEKMFHRVEKNNENTTEEMILKCIWDDSNLKQILKEEQEKINREIQLNDLMSVYINIPNRFRGTAYKQVIEENSPINIINIILECCDTVESNIERSNENLRKMSFKSGKEKKREQALAKNNGIRDETDKIRTDVIAIQTEINTLNLNFIKRYDALHKKIATAFQAKDIKLVSRFIYQLNIMLDCLNQSFEKLKEYKKTIASISVRLEDQIIREVRGITANWKVEQKQSQEAIEAERVRTLQRKAEQLKRKQNEEQAKQLEILREARHKQWEAQREAQRLAQKEVQKPERAQSQSQSGRKPQLQPNFQLGQQSNLSSKSAQRSKPSILSEFYSNKELSDRYLKKPPLVFSFDIFNKLMLTKTKEYKLLREILAMKLENPNTSDLLVERNALLGTFAQLMEKNKKANHLLFSVEMANKVRNVIFHTEILFPNFYDVENSLKMNHEIRNMLLKILDYISESSRKSILQTDTDIVVQEKINSDLFNRIMTHQLKDSKLLGCLLQLSAGDKELEEYKKTSSQFDVRIKKAAIGYTYARMGTFACDIKQEHEKEMPPNLFQECMQKYEKYIPLGCDYRHLKDSKRLNQHAEKAINSNSKGKISPKQPVQYVTAIPNQSVNHDTASCKQPVQHDIAIPKQSIQHDLATPAIVTITYVHLPTIEVTTVDLDDSALKKNALVRV